MQNIGIGVPGDYLLKNTISVQAHLTDTTFGMGQHFFFINT